MYCSFGRPGGFHNIILSSFQVYSAEILNTIATPPPQKNEGDILIWTICVLFALCDKLQGCVCGIFYLGGKLYFTQFTNFRNRNIPRTQWALFREFYDLSLFIFNTILPSNSRRMQKQLLYSRSKVRLIDRNYNFCLFFQLQICLADLTNVMKAMLF